MNIMENAQRLYVLYHTAQGTYVRAKQELEVDLFSPVAKIPSHPS